MSSNLITEYTGLSSKRICNKVPYLFKGRNIFHPPLFKIIQLKSVLTPCKLHLWPSKPYLSDAELLFHQSRVGFEKKHCKSS